MSVKGVWVLFLRRLEDLKSCGGCSWEDLFEKPMICLIVRSRLGRMCLLAVLDVAVVLVSHSSVTECFEQVSCGFGFGIC